MLLKNLSTNNFSLFLCTGLLLTGCATSEDIERQKSVDKLLVEMEGQQRISKSLILKLQNIENNIGLVSGKIEETQHTQELTETNSIEDLKKRIDTLEQENKKFINDTNSEIAKLHVQLNEQKEYLSTLLKEIKKVNSQEESNNISLFGQSIKNYKKKNYKEAKNQFLEIISDLNHHKLNQRDQALVFHNLGMTFFLEKDYKNSQIYFSKLFTDYQSSPLNPSGLYHLGLSFQRQKMEKEANDMWQVLLNKYPQSEFVKLIKKDESKK